MKDIFYNAHFGDKYMSRDGSVAIYLNYDEDENKHVLVDESITIISVDSEGFRNKGEISQWDIISKG